jgi:hypothetical protein
MRMQALSVLILATLVSSATANDEIKRLLADLSFGDAIVDDKADSLSQRTKPASQPVAAPAMEKPVIEKPVIEKPVIEKPVIEKPVIEASKPASSIAALPAFSELVAAGPGLQLPPEPEPKAVLAEPVPVTVPLMEIDPLKAADADLPSVVSIQPVETKSVGHRHHNSACEPYRYERGIVCMPRVSPNLPTSTFLQYFRGNPCYTNVWDGYRYDCGSHHAHIHGECDCFKRGNSGCESCDGQKRH